MPKPSDQNQTNKPTQTSQDQYLQQNTGDPNATPDVTTLIRSLFRAGGVPISLMLTPPPLLDTAFLLSQKPRLTVAFPPCAAELLSLYNKNRKDDVTAYFEEYFKFYHHRVFGQYFDPPPPPDKRFENLTPLDLADQLSDANNLDQALLNCPDNPPGGGPINFGKDTHGPRPDQATTIAAVHVEEGYVPWPSDCCICSPCVTLDGNRNPMPDPVENQPVTGSTNSPVPPRLRRLFVGDLVWLFYFERMGIFQILGAILDAYACNGRLPISNGSIDLPGIPQIRDDLVALILEIMVRQTKMGMSSTVRDRGCAYRTSLGWVSPPARKLNLDTVVNTGFNTLFHRFIYSALEFYKDKRLAVAIRGTAAPTSPPSVATLITVSDTIDVLKKRFEAFDYGRNYYNTLAGIVWAIAGMTVIRELVTTLGIASAFNDPHEYIPAAYNLLVLKQPGTSGETNRYLVHKECARNGRDLLLDMEVVNHQDRKLGGELENWLMQVEAKVEGYRTAYRALTGVDLGASATPVIEQQV